jgi:polyisoprenoid-binding protein YceI
MSKRTRIILIVAAVVVVVGGIGLYLFLRDDAPAKVSLDSAKESVSSTTGGNTDSGDLDGAWVVDTTSGEFDFESATGSFVGFRVQEELAGIGSTTAVGRTNSVTGSLDIEETTANSADFTVDLTTLTTNDSRRNDRVQGALETGEFPEATFTLTEPIDFGDAAKAGEKTTVTATGDLTIHGVTKSVDFQLDTQLVDGTIVVVGSTDVTFSDYGVQAPTAPIVLAVEDHGTLELQLLFVPA